MGGRVPAAERAPRDAPMDGVATGVGDATAVATGVATGVAMAVATAGALPTGVRAAADTGVPPRGAPIGGVDAGPATVALATDGVRARTPAIGKVTGTAAGVSGRAGVLAGAGVGDDAGASEGGAAGRRAGVPVPPATLVATGVARDTPPANDGTAVAPMGVTETGRVPPAMPMTPPHTEQRARTPVAGTLAGSTRNTERHSGHETVITRPQPYAFPSVRAPVRMPRPGKPRRHPDGGPRPTPIRVVSLHSSSFPWPTR